ncbi:MAG: response regulator [Cypionkella sp.]
MTAVLIVEDDAFINMEAIFIVEELGHSTLCAHDVEQAMTILQSEAQIDVMFTDIRLKDRRLGGYELAKEAVALRPGLCVLYTTGDKLADPDTGLVLEGSHFLQKPYGEIQLQVALAKALRAAQALRPAV